MTAAKLKSRLPDGHGGIQETVYVEVPAMQDEETGEEFLYLRSLNSGHFVMTALMNLAPSAVTVTVAVPLAKVGV